jgi:hypothetical protein
LTVGLGLAETAALGLGVAMGWTGRSDTFEQLPMFQRTTTATVKADPKTNRLGKTICERVRP